VILENEKYIKSPLNYTGGKHRLLPQILPLFPNGISSFVDLFTGGANVAVNTNAERIIANDICKPVIDIYMAMQSVGIETLLQEIKERIVNNNLTVSNKEAYLNFRGKYNESSGKNPLDLFILICHGFNNQIRFNKKGLFNMPFGKRTFNESTEKNLIDFHHAIKDISFSNVDFRDFNIDSLTKEDLVYCDPPYLITCATYNGQGGWTDADDKDLMVFLDGLNEIGIRFALSNVLKNKGKENAGLIEWSEKYNVYHLSNTYSNCSYHAKDRSKTTTDEVLITNYL